MEQLPHLAPGNFRELFSLFAFLISLIFAFISLSKSQLEHALRMAAIFFIITLSLFANNGFTYFAAVFIIATAVTQLDFLQNLAAIIRGNKEYFDHQNKKLQNEGGEKHSPQQTPAPGATSVTTSTETPSTMDKNEEIDRFLSNSSVIGIYGLYAVSLSKVHNQPFYIHQLCKEVRLLTEGYTNGYLIAASSFGLFSRASYAPNWRIVDFDGYLMAQIKDAAYDRKERMPEEAEYLCSQLKLIESFFGE